MISKNLTLIFFSFLFCFLILGGFVFAQTGGRGLEVPLPGIGGEAEITETPLLPNYIKYIFNFSIGIGGFISFIVLVYGGFRYLTSAGNPSAAGDAKDQIFSAFLGLGLLLGSWLLLTTINPQLIVINPQKQPATLPAVGYNPGVYLCRDAASLITSADCLPFTGSAERLGNFDNQTGYIKFIDSQDGNLRFGAVLHEDSYYGGRCRVCLGEGCDFIDNGNGVRGVSSIHVFSKANAMISPPGPGVTLYREDNYNSLIQGPISSTNIPYQNYTELGVPQTCQGGCCTRSIKIENEGKYLVGLYENTNGGDRCEIFTRSDPGLATNPIGVCAAGSNYGCCNSFFILPIDTLF